MPPLFGYLFTLTLISEALAGCCRGCGGGGGNNNNGANVIVVPGVAQAAPIVQPVIQTVAAAPAVIGNNFALGRSSAGFGNGRFGRRGGGGGGFGGGGVRFGGNNFNRQVFVQQPQQQVVMAPQQQPVIDYAYPNYGGAGNDDVMVVNNNDDLGGNYGNNFGRSPAFRNPIRQVPAAQPLNYVQSPIVSKTNPILPLDKTGQLGKTGPENQQVQTLLAALLGSVGGNSKLKINVNKKAPSTKPRITTTTAPPTTTEDQQHEYVFEAVTIEY